MHLIKQSAENRNTKSWETSIFNSVKQIQRINKRYKAAGTYLTREELGETLEDAYESALRQAALGAFEGSYEVQELGELVDKSKIIQKAIDLITA